MSRFNEIVKEIEQLHPNDWWSKAYRKKVPGNPIFEHIVSVYDKALDCLDPESFSILKDKVLSDINCEVVRNDDGRGRQLLFDKLNEAFAYKYLQNRGVNNLCFFEEINERVRNQSKTPDIRFEENGQVGYCEVKTINRSDKDIKRYKNHEQFSGSEYDLNDGFFNKLCDALDTAISQVKTPSDSELGIAYLIIIFDDFTLIDYPKYKEQLLIFFQQSYPDIEIHALIPGWSFRVLNEIHHP